MCISLIIKNNKFLPYIFLFNNYTILRKSTWHTLIVFCKHFCTVLWRQLLSYSIEIILTILYCYHKLNKFLVLLLQCKRNYLTLFCLYYLSFLVIHNCFVCNLVTLTLHQYLQFNFVLVNTLEYPLLYMDKIMFVCNIVFPKWLSYFPNLWSV